LSEERVFGNQILALVTAGLVRAAEAEGLDANQLLEQAGLTWEAILDPDAYVPIERHVAVGRAMMARLPGVNAGLHTGAAIYGDAKGALGFAIRRSARHGRALGQFCRFLAVTNECLYVDCEHGSEGVGMRLEMVAGLAALGHPTEALFAAWVSIARFATGVRWVPVRVDFRHQALGPTSEHEGFFGCPVLFEAASSCLRIDPSALALPIDAIAHPFDRTLEQLRARLLALGPAAQHAAISGLIVALGDGVMPPPMPDRALQVSAAELLIGGSPAVPAFEVAFLLGFPSVRALRAAVGRGT
jgi:hypothetical protein